jgi:hypothetical protein
MATSSYINAGRTLSAVGPIGATVTGATNATPIVVTYAADAEAASGDEVQITGVVGNTAANGTFYIAILGPTTAALYSDAALSVPVAGNGAYTSGGAVSDAFDISGMVGDWTVVLKVEAVTANKGGLIYLQDSLDGFVADIHTVDVMHISGPNPIGGTTKSWRKYNMPYARFGVALAKFRLYVGAIDAGCTAQLTLSIQQ